jgi:hypothetical protein
MKPSLRILAGFCLAGAAGLVWQNHVQAQDLPALQGSPHGPPTEGIPAPAQNLESVPGLVGPGVPKLTITRPGGHVAHIMPTVQGAAALAQARSRAGLSGPLLYHAGGSIMKPYPIIYEIFWGPPTLQNGGATGFSAQYGTVQFNLAAYYGQGHGLASNNTQYYEISGSTTTYIQAWGGLVTYYVDSAAYPASGCTDTLTPGNCITDAQIQAEITKVMGINGWTGGINKIFLLYTSSGEGSCMDATNASCAYTQYCAYHSFISGATPIIYGNEPYGGTPQCYGGVGQMSPNSDTAADGAASVASHEITEAITDPLLNAWFDASGNEIGDLCNFTFGTNTWDSGKANQMWNGLFFDLQEQFSNNKLACVQSGP